ncbi:ABC transporter substrate-binding protein [Candidatus Acetothermia bacterium]|nr:ABC transporter substrate-binding protein [Candidatus Acetothermia bacterium]
MLFRNFVSLKKWVVYLTALALTLTLSALAIGQGASRDQTFIIGTSFNLKTLDPGRSFELTSILSNKALYETLVTLAEDGNGDVIPQLAESWQISADGLTYTFKLKSGISFSSGNPLTANDVVFSIERFQLLKGPASFLADTIDSVTATDASTVAVHLKQVDPALLSKLTVGNFGILDSKSLIANGGTDDVNADKSDQAENFLNSHSAGTGPYLLVSTDLSTEIVLARNASYRLGQAPFAEYILRNIPDAAVQGLTLQKGDIDVALDITADQVATLKGDSNVQIVPASPLITIFLGFNKKPEIAGGNVNQVLVEQAIRNALDYQGIDFLGGVGSITPATIIPVGINGALDASFAPARNLEQARTLLQQAGLPNGFQTTLEYPGSFTFGGIDFDVLAQKVQADLAEVGIKVTLAPEQIDAFFTRLRAGQIPFFISFWTPDFLDALNYTAFLPGGIYDGRTNWSAESNSAVYQQLKSQSTQVQITTDNAQRVELFKQIQLTLRDNGPLVSLIQPSLPVAASAKLKGFVFNPQWRVDPYIVSRQ